MLEDTTTLFDSVVIDMLFPAESVLDIRECRAIFDTVLLALAMITSPLEAPVESTLERETPLLAILSPDMELVDNVSFPDVVNVASPLIVRLVKSAPEKISR